MGDRDEKGQQGDSGLTVAARETTEEAMQTALRRLLGHPEGLRAFASAGKAGVFTSKSAAAQRTADQLEAAGFVRRDHQEAHGVVVYILTERGHDWLLERESPTLLLEDLLRVAEAQSEQLRTLEDWCRQQQTLLRQQVADVGRALARLSGSGARPHPAVVEELPVEEMIADYLRRHAEHAAPVDGTLGELYRALLDQHPDLTIGQFHDAIRNLREAGRVRLSPWTGPLYQLPEPALALLIGHEVLYYVHLRASRVAG